MSCLQRLWSAARPGTSRHVPSPLTATAVTPAQCAGHRTPHAAPVVKTSLHLTTIPRRWQFSSANTRPVSESFRTVMRHVPHPVVVITALDCPTLKVHDTGKRSARVPDHWADSEIPHSVARGQDVDGSSVLGPLPRAMTASSFTSLTLHPAPTILFNVTLPSRSHSAILASRAFNVHILSADQHGAKVADLFARGYSNAPSSSIGEHGDGKRRRRLGLLAGLDDIGVHVDGQQQWEDVWLATLQSSAKDLSVMLQELPAPLLRGPGILHVLQCRLVNLKLLEGEESRHFALVAGQVTKVISTPTAASEEQFERRSHKCALSYVDGAYRGPSPAVMRHSTISSSR
ncbi:flavin reductase like domain-domain-containing protein [Microdochium bolleyi]|uniref:Flavin reductase like domain-domain-containing protein n=1 Tax=Microdochium bolleyi TaxID=196109 RepID=A0A136J731_9PEZI|nr:flavin reductase like domain-domain-containing protein [Microdochium bolleyi]